MIVFLNSKPCPALRPQFTQMWRLFKTPRAPWNMQHLFVFIALPNNWPIKSKSLPTFVHPSVTQSPPYVRLAIACQSNILWPFACRFCWPSPTNVAKVRSPTESNCSSLHVLCRFGNSPPSWHRRFTLYIFDFALACKNSMHTFGRSVR